jgi:O-antigen/teichoic acid export membrane protein
MVDPNESPQTRRIALIGLLCTGGLLLGLALFGSPIGADPDTGVLELSDRQLRWLLGTLGLVFLAGAALSIWRGRS